MTADATLMLSTEDRMLIREVVECWPHVNVLGDDVLPVPTQRTELMALARMALNHLGGWTDSETLRLTEWAEGSHFRDECSTCESVTDQVTWDEPEDPEGSPAAVVTKCLRCEWRFFCMDDRCDEHPGRCDKHPVCQ